MRSRSREPWIDSCSRDQRYVLVSVNGMSSQPSAAGSSGTTNSWVSTAPRAPATSRPEARGVPKVRTSRNLEPKGIQHVHDRRPIRVLRRKQPEGGHVIADWILVACLGQLRNEFDRVAPGRDHASDGSIGDAAHQREVSDHNPDETGSVPIHDA